MVPQGSTVLNTAVFTQMTATLNSIDSCAELQALTNEAFASIGAVKSAIEAQLEALLPIQELLTAPEAALGAIVTWATNVINHVLTPLFAPYANYVTQLAQLTEQIAALAQAVQAAEARIAHCSITIPPI